MPAPRHPTKITDLRGAFRGRGPPVLFKAPFPPGRHGKRITASLGPPPVRIRRASIPKRRLSLGRILGAALGGAAGAALVGSCVLFGAWVGLLIAPTLESPATAALGVFTVEDE